MAGRGKKKQITNKELKQAEEYAFNGCKNNTICGLMGWNHNFLEDRPDILKRLAKKRAEREFDLRKAQTDTAIKAKNAVMQIFLGKNELGQSDKQETRHDVGDGLAELLRQIKPTKGILPAEEKVIEMR